MNFLAAATLSVALLLAASACSSKPTTSSQSTSKVDGAQIKDNLKQANLSDVKVDVDNEKKVVTLKGDVQSDSAKQQAEDIARSNAGDYIVADEIGVRPGNDAAAKKVDEHTDEAIKSQWKALEAQNNWGGQHIRTSVKNGVLTLKGDVDTPGQRENIERSAAEIPGVQQVVNELDVKNAGR